MTYNFKKFIALALASGIIATSVGTMTRAESDSFGPTVIVNGVKMQGRSLQGRSLQGVEQRGTRHPGRSLRSKIPVAIDMNALTVSAITFPNQSK